MDQDKNQHELSDVQEPLSPLAKLAIVIGCMIYICSPIDLLPDLIPVVGRIDDLGALAFMFSTLLSGTKKPE
ncbi:MAG: DUF1232 domain-containing protein [Phycisphaerales bacterium]|nr:DUF1232 domain-containing protein [Phycisphaerales bacterium]